MVSGDASTAAAAIVLGASFRLNPACESVPAKRRVGDKVFAGSSNVEGSITVQFIIGMGVAAVMAPKRLHVGSERFLRSLGIATGRAARYLAEAENHGHIALVVALGDSLVEAIACSDAPRPEARAVVEGSGLLATLNPMRPLLAARSEAESAWRKG